MESHVITAHKDDIWARVAFIATSGEKESLVILARAILELSNSTNELDDAVGDLERIQDVQNAAITKLEHK